MRGSYSLLVHLHFAGEKVTSEESSTEEGKDVKKNAEINIRSHPLFFGITLGLLAEIINSR